MSLQRLIFYQRDNFHHCRTRRNVCQKFFSRNIIASMRTKPKNFNFITTNSKEPYIQQEFFKKGLPYLIFYRNDNFSITVNSKRRLPTKIFFKRETFVASTEERTEPEYFKLISTTRRNVYHQQNFSRNTWMQSKYFN